MSREYQIKLTGQLLQGRAPDQVLQLLSDLFQIPVEEGRALLQGQATTLPRKLDLATAEQICHRFRNVGAECSVEQSEELDYQLELIEEGAEASPYAEAPTAQEADLSGKLHELTQQLAETEKDLADSAFVLELIPLEEEEKPLPKVGHIHVPTLSSSFKPQQPQHQAAAGAEAGADPAAQEASDSEASSGEAGEEEIAIGQAAAGGGSAGLGGMLPQASVQPTFRRPDEILTAKPKSRLPLMLALALLVLVAAGAGYWQFFLATAEPEVVKVQQTDVSKEPVEVDTSQFTAFEIEETRARLENLAKSLRTWQLEFNNNKEIPAQETLMVQLKKDLGLTDTDWSDVWGHPISLQNRIKGYILVSPGMDGKIDTQDDIDLILEF
jgi:hypothetical protein